MTGVFCLGIATLDYVYSVETMPTRGEKYRARDLAVVGGGCAGNASVAAARLGAAAWLATRLGDDAVADLILAGLVSEQVEIRFARRVADTKSPVSAIMVDARGERMVVSYSDPAMPEETAWLPRTLPPGADAVLADTRWGEGALAVLKLARAAGVPGLLDGDRKPPHPDLVATASHVAFSVQGLRELSGEDDPREGLARLAREHDTWLAVTLGRDGVLFLEEGRIVHSPAFDVRVVDTLGAGDVWHGAFAVALAEGVAEREAVRFASAAAALKCTRFGGRAGAPTRGEVEGLLASTG